MQISRRIWTSVQWFYFWQYFDFYGDTCKKWWYLHIYITTFFDVSPLLVSPLFTRITKYHQSRYYHKFENFSSITKISKKPEAVCKVVVKQIKHTKQSRWKTHSSQTKEWEWDSIQKFTEELPFKYNWFKIIYSLCIVE